MSSNKPGSLRRHARAVVMKIIGIQVLIGLLMAIGLLFFKGLDAAYSVLVGVLIGVLPSYYLGSRMFGADSVTSGDLLLKQIYVAEMMKLGFTVALFLITILFVDAKFPMVLCGYAAVVAVNWLAMKFSDLGVAASPTVTEAN
jgi:F0F1-type ATP synthase assembly protein I